MVKNGLVALESEIGALNIDPEPKISTKKNLQKTYKMLYVSKVNLPPSLGRDIVVGAHCETCSLVCQAPAPPPKSPPKFRRGQKKLLFYSFTEYVTKRSS